MAHNLIYVIAGVFGSIVAALVWAAQAILLQHFVQE